MISPEVATTACTHAAEAHATAGAAWPDAIHLTMRALIDRLAIARELKAPLGDSRCPAAENALDQLGPLDGWHILDLGEIHQRLLELTPHQDDDGTVTASRKDLARRADQGSWYTPPELAATMCHLSIGPQLDRLAQDPDPGAMYDVLAIDPSCGAGVYLLEAARYITGRLVQRVTGLGAAPDAHIRAAMPTVMRECIFGVDIDPVAVDLAKAALWLEIDGREPFGFMDRNVICGNALDDDMPPAFTERRGDPPTAAERRAAYHPQTAPT